MTDTASSMRWCRAAHTTVVSLTALLADAGRLVSWSGAEDLAAEACDFGAAALHFAANVAEAETPGAASLGFKVFQKVPTSPWTSVETLLVEQPQAHLVIRCLPPTQMAWPPRRS